jgi:GntR family transcriptional regulator of arabinose operon
MPLATRSKVENIYNILQERILSGSWPIGVCLPTENQLAAEFGCGRNTVSKAIDRLAHDGFVDRRKRAGTKVLVDRREINKPLVELDGFAFIYPSDRHEGIWRTVSGFQEAAHEMDRRVVTLSTGASFEKEAEMIRRLGEFDVRGAVICPLILSSQEQLALAQVVLESKIPIVLADHNPSGINCSSVRLDCFHAGYRMTNYLIGKGLKQIGFFTNNSLAASVRSRYHGYLWALQEASLQEDPHNTLLESGMHPNFEDPILEPTRLAVDYLRGSSNLEAVVCANDYLALGMIKAAQTLGRRVPDDLPLS